MAETDAPENQVITKDDLRQFENRLIVRSAIMMVGFVVGVVVFVKLL
jgi:hypothetical protein